MVVGRDTAGILARLVHFDIAGARSNLPLIEHGQHWRTAAGVSRTAMRGPAGGTAG